MNQNYKHRKTGIIISPKKSGGYETTTQFFIPDWMVEGSSDWEKVEENPWEIYTLSNNGRKVDIAKLHLKEIYYVDFDGCYKKLDYFLTKGYTIHTVSNGKEEFSVGDYVTTPAKIEGTINLFKYEKDQIWVELTTGSSGAFARYASFNIKYTNSLIKKPVLYTTDEIKEITKQVNILKQLLK